MLFDDRFGGPAKRVVLVAEQLRSQGIETTLILPEGTGNAEEMVRSAGLPVRRLGFQRIPRPTEPLSVLLWLLTLPRDVFRFLRFYRRDKPDLVHVNGGFFVAPAWAARLARVPLVWHLNDTVMPTRLAPFVGWQTATCADQVVVSSQAVGAHYAVADRSAILYPPVDVDLIQPRGDAGDHHGRPSLERPLRIGLVANWNPIKGVDDFISACALVRDRLGDALQVKLVGSRLANHVSLQRRIDALIEDFDLGATITELGFQPNVHEVLSELDIVVMASRSEAASVVVLEGMAAGLPVVATDVGGVRELLLREPEEPAGIVVPVSDPPTMAAVILELAADPTRRRAMGAIGRRRAETNFSTAVITSKHVEIYRRLTAKNGASGALDERLA